MESVITAVIIAGLVAIIAAFMGGTTGMIFGKKNMVRKDLCDQRHDSLHDLLDVKFKNVDEKFEAIQETTSDIQTKITELLKRGG